MTESRKFDSSAVNAITAASSPADVAAAVSTALFGDASVAKVLTESSEKLSWLRLAPGDQLFQQGDPADALYFVVRGGLTVRIHGVEGTDIDVGKIGAGEPVGEMQVFSGGARTASVCSTDGCELIRIPRASIDGLTKSAPEAYERLSNRVESRLRRNRLISSLTDLLGSVDDDLVHDIEEAAKWHRVPRGDFLFHKGDPGDSVYMVVSGRLRASLRDDADHEQVFGEIRRGETVGEAAPFTGSARSADVYALRDSELISFSNDAFETLGDKHPVVLRRIASLAMVRLQRAQGTGAALAPTTSIAVVALSDDVDLDGFISHLGRSLSSSGSTLCVNATSADQTLGTPGLSQLAETDARSRRIDAWLDEVEIRNSFLVLEADKGPTAWSKRCVRQADEIVLVARAGSNPTVTQAEKDLLGTAADGAKIVLVLVHPESTVSPSATATWLEPRKIHRHHHVRDGSHGDIMRVARFIAGRALGVAFGGGGARGFAHIGVVRAMMELGIPIDAVGGTSMGAMISAQVALGWKTDGMSEACSQLFGSWASDVTLPYVSLLGGHKSRTRMQQSIPDVLIEDLWLRYFCVSTSLMTGAIVVHNSGPLRTGLRASASLPGVLPPVIVGDDMLVDGALLRNLPTDLTADLCCGGPVIALDVSGPIEMAAGSWTGDSISGWQVLAQKLNPWSTQAKVPSLAAILQRSIEIPGSAVERSVMEEFSGLYLKLPVQQFGLLDFKCLDQIANAGYEFARPRLERWLEANPLMR